MPRTLWNSPPVPLLSQINPDHNFSSYFFNTRFNVICPFMSRSSKRPISFRLPSIEDLQAFIFAPMRAAYPALHMPLYLIELMTSGEERRSVSASLCGSFQPPATCSLERRTQNVSQLLLSSGTLGLFPSLSVRKAVSH